MNYARLIVESDRHPRIAEPSQCGIRKSDVDQIEDFGDFKVKHKRKSWFRGTQKTNSKE